MAGTAELDLKPRDLRTGRQRRMQNNQERFFALSAAQRLRCASAIALRPAALSLRRLFELETLALFLLPAGRPLRLVTAALPPRIALAC